MVSRKLKGEILEVLMASKDAPDAMTIVRRLKKLRLTKALKELEAAGLVEWDEEYKGWRLRKEAEG